MQWSKERREHWLEIEEVTIDGLEELEEIIESV